MDGHNKSTRLPWHYRNLGRVSGMKERKAWKRRREEKYLNKKKTLQHLKWLHSHERSFVVAVPPPTFFQCVTPLLPLGAPQYLTVGIALLNVWLTVDTEGLHANISLPPDVFNFLVAKSGDITRVFFHSFVKETQNCIANSQANGPFHFG